MNYDPYIAVADTEAPRIVYLADVFEAARAYLAISHDNPHLPLADLAACAPICLACHIAWREEFKSIYHTSIIPACVSHECTRLIYQYFSPRDNDIRFSEIWATSDWGTITQYEDGLEDVQLARFFALQILEDIARDQNWYVTFGF